MEIHLNEEEEAALQRYADTKGITFEEAFQRMLNVLSAALIKWGEE
jgi:hypothetical protein